MLTCFLHIWSMLMRNMLKTDAIFWRKTLPQTHFGSYFQKGKIFPFGKESVFPFQKNHPLSEDRKFKLLLCMSLVFCALGNLSFNDDNHILRFFTEGFENLSSSFFLISKICYQVLSKECRCIYTSHLGSFI